ncbi:NAD(P)H-dependent oxidoreductase [Neisseria sp. 83E34]|uniref:NAD(P)H-dependent oxidoreductase n=1 Tax=Neisseria sp. 83E34 TaxID=1692264 RepID=UPI001E55673D|nr:NAD(P)H-dependent oxidoreductase [Neisseria sp. 83E34]
MMKKTLIIVAHPDIKHSTVNSRWIHELEKYPETFTIHQLYQSYPDGHIDKLFEQKLIESHMNIVLQFPVYWFSSPPLLKQWQDEVLTYGWAYGVHGDKLRDKKMGLAVSTGITAQDYSQQGRWGMTLPEILSPFELTAKYIRADYQTPFIFYGIDSHASYNAEALQKIDQSAQNYIEYLQRIFR